MEIALLILFVILKIIKLKLIVDLKTESKNKIPI